MIAIIDYGMGNLGSILNMLKKIQQPSFITSNKDEILNSDKVILPGVGSFDMAMTNLNNLGLTQTIMDFAATGKPLLGICLGMQLLADRSEEGKLPGLGLVSGEVKRFSSGTDLKIPHMGWNIIYPNETNFLFVGHEEFEELRYYFVHSYYFSCSKRENVSAETEYGLKFTSAVRNNHVYGVQFHPEKSHRYGMLVMNNFAKL